MSKDMTGSFTGRNARDYLIVFQPEGWLGFFPCQMCKYNQGFKQDHDVVLGEVERYTYAVPEEFLWLKK